MTSMMARVAKVMREAAVKVTAQLVGMVGIAVTVGDDEAMAAMTVVDQCGVEDDVHRFVAVCEAILVEAQDSISNVTSFYR